MPVLKCSNGKYRIGKGPCMYKSKASADRAYAAYRAKKYSGLEKDDKLKVYKRAGDDLFDVKIIPNFLGLKSSEEYKIVSPSGKKYPMAYLGTNFVAYTSNPQRPFMRKPDKLYIDDFVKGWTILDKKGKKFNIDFKKWSDKKESKMNLEKVIKEAVKEVVGQDNLFRNPGYDLIHDPKQGLPYENSYPGDKYDRPDDEVINQENEKLYVIVDYNNGVPYVIDGGVVYRSIFSARKKKDQIGIGTVFSLNYADYERE